MMVLDLQLCETPRTPENERAKAAVGGEAMTPTLTPTPEGLYYLPVEEIGPEPVDAGQKGEGWPYAPEGWPTPDDKWTWRVGRRKNARGFWQDRYLILPKRLQKGGRKVWFFSKKAVQDYLTREFPDTDLDRFFASFQWDVPCSPEGKTTFCGKRGREVEEDGNVAGQEKICKAGNPRCGLETGKSNSLKAMNCDICCIELGFCRECSCILCGKATDQSVGEVSSIRCEGKLNEEFVCGHVAHLECALLCHMAGVEKSAGLDMEYYCRRCDKKTDLIMHIEGLIHASGSLNIRADVEKNLSLALRITQGTRQTAGRSLQKIINSALEKIQSGMNVEDIVELQQNLVAVDAGKAADESERLNYQQSPHVSVVNTRGDAVQQPGCIPSFKVKENGTNESSFRNLVGARSQVSNALQPAGQMSEVISQKRSALVHEREQRRLRVLREDVNGASDLLSSPVHITALKFENKINQALHGLRRSQEAEYKLAQEKLYAQKDFLLSLFQQLDIANSEFTNSSSSSSLENFDELLVGVSDQVGRLRKENAKLGKMLKITNGFGRTPKDILRDCFGLSLEDGLN